MLCDDGDVERITEVIQAAATTGKIGDGKIWVVDVAGRCGSAPASGTPTPSDRFEGETVRAA